MSYDDELAQRIREQVATATAGDDALTVTEKKMFGGLAFLVNGAMAVAAGSDGGAMVRCDPARTDEFTARDGVSLMSMGGRTMSGWLRVDAGAVSDDDRLREWVQTGVTYAASLPPRPEKPAKKTTGRTARRPAAGA